MSKERGTARSFGTGAVSETWTVDGDSGKFLISTKNSRLLSEIETFMRKDNVQDEFATDSSKDCFGPASGLPSSIAALFC